MSDREMPFFEHLGELRTRVIHIFVGILAGFIVAYVFRIQLFQVLTVPFDEAYRAVFDRDPQLITTGLLESFLVYLKVAFVGGIFISCPYLFTQAWLFVSPGLKSRERRHAIPFVLLATLFFLGGASFGYGIVFPLGFEYFLRIAPGDYIQPMIRMQEYFHLASWMLLVFGFTFEAPLIVLYLAYFGWLTPQNLMHPWRGILVGILVASAILTPADPVSMVLLALPLMGLYGVTILLSFLVARRSNRSGLAKDSIEE